MSDFDQQNPSRRTVMKRAIYLTSAIAVGATALTSTATNVAALSPKPTRIIRTRPRTATRAASATTSTMAPVNAAASARSAQMVTAITSRRNPDLDNRHKKNGRLAPFLMCADGCGRMANLLEC